MVANKILAYNDQGTTNGYQLLTITEMDAENRVFIGLKLWQDNQKWVLSANAQQQEVSFNDVLLNNISLTQKYELSQKNIRSIKRAIKNMNPLIQR